MKKPRPGSHVLNAAAFWELLGGGWLLTARGVAQVYRLICCGTVEEKIYRKQVFKGGLSRHGMEEGIPFQYFTDQVGPITFGSRASSRSRCRSVSSGGSELASDRIDQSQGNRVGGHVFIS